MQPSDETSIIVCGELPLRRAELVALLGPWAREMGLGLLDMPLAQLLGEPPPESRCRMVLVAIGAAPLARSATLEGIALLVARYRTAPIVVLADAESGPDAAAAFRAGARGFIPATMEPSATLNALAFILGGGHFFPPGLLQASPDTEPPATPDGVTPAPKRFRLR